MEGSNVARRLAAVLAADVVGYSRLMEADEVGTLARLKTVRLELIDPAIAKVFKLHYGHGLRCASQGATMFANFERKPFHPVRHIVCFR